MSLSENHVTKYPALFYSPQTWIVYVYVTVGVDETVVVTLKFSKNRMALFTCSSAVQLPNDAIIVGTKGTIRVGEYLIIIKKSVRIVLIYMFNMKG